MGVVYKAHDGHLDRIVAIKVLPPEKVSDPARKRRFMQEARAASALNHPNIVTIHDIDPAGGVDFVYESGHVPPRQAVTNDMLDWLDKYLGPVQTK